MRISFALLSACLMFSSHAFASNPEALAPTRSVSYKCDFDRILPKEDQHCIAQGRVIPPDMGGNGARGSIEMRCKGFQTLLRIFDRTAEVAFANGGVRVRGEEHNDVATLVIAAPQENQTQTSGRLFINNEEPLDGVCTVRNSSN